MIREEKDHLDFLVEKIKESGIPLEIYVSNILDDKNWEVEPKANYLDYDTEKEREIDIKASLESNVDIKTDHFYMIKLIIECKKKPENSWIFFKNRTQYINESLQLTSLIKTLKSSSLSFMKIFNLKNTELINIPFCTHYTEIKCKKQPKMDNIFESLLQIKKANTYEIKQIDKENKKYIDQGKFQLFSDSKNFDEYVEVLMPVIIFDGRLYVTERKNPYNIKKEDLKETNIVKYMIEPPLKTLSSKEHVSVYIVKKEYFEKFIKDIHNLEKILNKRLEENSEELKKDLESAYIKYL
ncbi:MAG: hypothetical protein KAI53_04650, partial [Candidatus Aenigmarchaeota archaeon]|nr:hypothetical protein [Candidatus Aenigmarchaeota archaeon]